MVLVLERTAVEPPDRISHFIVEITSSQVGSGPEHGIVSL